MGRSMGNHGACQGPVFGVNLTFESDFPVCIRGKARGPLITCYANKYMQLNARDIIHANKIINKYEDISKHWRWMRWGLLLSAIFNILIGLYYLRIAVNAVYCINQQICADDNTDILLYVVSANAGTLLQVWSIIILVVGVVLLFVAEMHWNRHIDLKLFALMARDYLNKQSNT